MTIRFFVFTIISFFSSITIAQNDEQTITGKILDITNNEPIAFASIYLKGQSIGTTSNEEGKFIFHISNFKDANTIVISSLGYGSVEKRIGDFTTNQNIFLSTQIKSLDEVVIKTTKKKKLTAKQIVKKAYQEINKNYPNQPYILEGFVRDLQKEDSTYVEYLECAAKFYNQPTDIETEAKVELVEIRNRYIAQKNPWNEQWDRKNSIIDLIEDDFIRFDYGPIKGKNGWKYELEDILLYNKKYVYKIKGTDPPFQKAILYIDTESFAFVRLELTRSAHNGKSWKRRLTNGQEQVYYNVIFEYQEYNNKMYLKYQKEEDTWKIYDVKKPNNLLFIKNPKKELFINKIIVDDLDKYPFQQNMNIGNSLENQSNEYNAAFWSKYNAPQKTKEISKIEQYLKKVDH
ncbi:carboxypeptidase-like regulatory domain-containing protein [Aquimarina mytili]|uniref:Carboxypeptidase-like regulatory domain-containing protein n=1 Tax=Aquimarina mytili TaxID=874423 RepID=A0A937D909_9FLAO|nr:carboxypeptidase-like regulatory domain-containing protein [Aquimarina mytili]MBL0682033.1 carboxypeptidase-like regulatory domain-containing protein [Aquimarina mytili]